MKLLSAFLSSIVTSIFFITRHQSELDNMTKLKNPLYHNPDVKIYYTAHNQSSTENYIWVAAKSIEDGTNYFMFHNSSSYNMPDSNFTIEFITLPKIYNFSPGITNLTTAWCPECVPRQVILEWITTHADPVGDMH